MNEATPRAFREVNYDELMDSVIDLLGELRSAEAAENVVNALCFHIEVMYSESGFSVIWFEKSISTFQNALVKIGNPSIAPLLNVIKGTSRVFTPPYMPGLIKEDGKKRLESSLMRKMKEAVARGILYLIVGGDLAIYHLEKALKEEPDEKKKENLSEAITKFREGLKSGVYNK